MKCNLKVALLLAMTLFSHLSVLQAKEQRFEEFKCTINLPENWSVMQAPQKADDKNVLFAATDQGKVLGLTIVPLSKDATIHDPDLIRGIEDGVRNQANQEISFIGGDYITFKQLPAYSALFRVPNGEDSMSVTVLMTAANGYGYSFTCVGHKGALMDDPEFTAALNGFNFIGEPELHEGKSSAEKLGYMTGTFLIPAMIIGLFFYLRYRAKKYD